MVKSQYLLGFFRKISAYTPPHLMSPPSLHDKCSPGESGWAEASLLRTAGREQAKSLTTTFADNYIFFSVKKKQ